MDKGKVGIESLRVSKSSIREVSAAVVSLSWVTAVAYPLIMGLLIQSVEGLFSKGFCYLLISCGALRVYAGHLF